MSGSGFCLSDPGHDLRLPAAGRVLFQDPGLPRLINCLIDFRDHAFGRGSILCGKEFPYAFHRVLIGFLAREVPDCPPFRLPECFFC